MSARAVVLTALTTLVSACAASDPPPSGPPSLRAVPPWYYSHTLRRYVPGPPLAPAHLEAPLSTSLDSRQLDDADDKLRTLQWRLNQPLERPTE